MKFGIVLPTYLYSAERGVQALRSYVSLGKTEVPDEDKPLISFTVAANLESGDLVAKCLAGLGKFTGVIWPQPVDVVGGIDTPLAWMVEKFFAETDCTHVIELADDMVYNPRWFIELKALVERHPDARAWSVYRSAHTRHHRTLEERDGDHRVTSMAGNGTCWTRDEWKAWGVSWKHGPTWPVPSGGDTLDLHHAYFRPGDRWATGRSWMEHIGAIGLHATGTPEHAVDFVGEE